MKLQDGSILALTPDPVVLAFHTEFAELSIPWTSVTDASVDGTNWILRLRNGDRIRGRPTDPELVGSGFVKRIRIPCETVRSITPAPPRPQLVAPACFPPKATVSLRDGSSIRAEFPTGSLRVRTLLLGTIDFGMDELRRLDLAQEPATITLRAGDKIVGTVQTARVEAKTAMGTVEVPVDRVTGITFHTDPAGGGLPEGLVAYYPFDEPGPDVRDASGNGNDGKAHGARLAEDGAIGGCFEFHGGPDEGDFVQVPHSATLVSMQETRELTLCAWIHPRSIPHEFPVILGKGGNQPPACNGGYDFCLNVHGNNDLHCNGDTMGFVTTGANGRLINRRIGRWIHVAIALVSTDSRAEFEYYVNAERVPEKNVDGNHRGLSANFDIPNDLYIGGPDPKHHPNRSFFDGKIDEVMIFNRRLSEEEIRGIYEQRDVTDDNLPPAPVAAPGQEAPAPLLNRLL